MSTHKLINSAFLQISSDSPYNDQWICDESWLTILKAKCSTSIEPSVLTRENLNRALGKLVGSFDSSNYNGVYMKQYKTICPFGIQRRSVRYYYRKVHGEAPAEPRSVLEVQDVFAKSFARSIAKSQEMQQNQQRISGGEKRKRDSDKSEGADDAVEVCVVEPPKTSQENMEDKEISPPNEINRAELARSEMTYWNSTEAAKLFGFGTDSDVLEKLKERVELLRKVNETEDGYKLVLPMDKVESPLTSHHIFTTRQKALFLLKAYILAIKHMNKWKWSDCCAEAVKELNSLGIKKATSGDSLSTWSKQFAKDGEKFPLPSAAKRKKDQLPQFFVMFPDAKTSCLQFASENIDKFSIALMRSELSTNIIPRLVQELEADGSEADTAKTKHLKHLTENPPSKATVFRWITALGITFCKNGKR